MTCRRLSLPAPALDVHRSGPKELQRGSLRLLDAHQKPSGERGLLARRSWVTDEIGIYTRLSYDASERAHGHLSVARYDRSVLVPSSACLTNLTWLPFWLTYMNPAASNLRFTSRYDSGLSGTELHLDGAHPVAWWLVRAVRSTTLWLRAGFPEPLFRFRLDWPRRPPGTAPRTNLLLATRSRRTSVSSRSISLCVSAYDLFRRLGTHHSKPSTTHTGRPRRCPYGRRIGREGARRRCR